MNELTLDPLFIFVTIGSILLLACLLLQLFVLRKVNALSQSNVEQIKFELVNLLQQNEDSLKQGLSESRKELRDVSADNRREINGLFISFQDTLLKRVSENSSGQSRQLDTFKTSLSGLSENLIRNSSELKRSVSLSFQETSEALNKKQDEFREKTQDKLNAFEQSITSDAKENRQELNASLKSFEQKFSLVNKEFTEQLGHKFADLKTQQLAASLQEKTSIVEIRETIEKQLKAIREDNTQQLGEMRKTVDEKLHETLEKRLGESFKLVSERLELVHKGLGEMQNLAVGVGDLKKVLSNVKTRGILGEYQLGNILEQVLAPEQYAVNVATKKGSQANVEYAVKLPGKSDEKVVWLPIDSKFPLESYQLLLQAIEAGDQVKIDQAQKQLLKAIEGFAKDISTKYIDPPNTTDFAIMFLPVESLYAEVLRHPELFEKLQRTYRITITGPTTLSALLNSLHMGFRTLAVQKRSSEVWKVLAEVKTEFVKYAGQLDKVQKQLNTASSSLENLQSTRTSAMERKLRGVETLEIDKAADSLDILNSPANNSAD
ncbi:DNA recombination protein RmuC [Bathymodiolus japonicus methanotrophic gill symbiont]|uniref:DNA recombination protein RmuC n=1 Tax=Bathymodiolus japonicus methanotrophic gill symbiont TaxID=113269 RepID=UPI001B3CCFF1|nr:DNA recombination protein RmuC [Bathymodiolus japonicus methanotrophic gill symbiont]GFO71497.1 DNA recombination protein RmuC [Bathymodiolus japonicus methanotrophic gill symbiont]